MTGTGDVTIRWATSGDTDAVARVLSHAAQWIESRGEPLWSMDELHPERLRADVLTDRYAIAEDVGECVAVVRLTDEDTETWPNAVFGEALYVHRLAVLRSHAGGVASVPLLAWCRDQARHRGIPLLRLDCDARRERLRELYASFGFRFHSLTTVGPYTVARFELSVSEVVSSPRGSAADRH